MIKLWIFLLAKSLLVSPYPECLFAYDLLMNRSRLDRHVPVRKLLGTGELLDYRLDFIMYSKVHSGCLPTIIYDPITPQPGVWGVAWEIDSSSLFRLDDSKGFWLGVNTKSRLPVRIRTLGGGSTYKERMCIVYYTSLIQGFKKPIGSDFSKLPKERAPSPSLIEELKRLGKQFRLGSRFLMLLDTVPHNGDFTPEMQFPNPKIKKYIKNASSSSQFGVKIRNISFGAGCASVAWMLASVANKSIT